ncbi:MAG: type IX secretion system sortase PorU [Paludibacteraceae bacterium]|nr:type IX secretion system sortase PorU [Paludibacteraceae bacterium]
MGILKHIYDSIFRWLMLAIMVFSSCSMACGERVKFVRCMDGAGWYSWNGQVFYSDGGVTWDTLGMHTRNSCMTWKSFAVGRDGRIVGDNPPLGVALHEVDRTSLCHSGQEFVGEEFTNATKEQSFMIDLPGIKAGSEATVRVRMAQSGLSVATATIKVNDVVVGTLTVSAPVGDDKGKASTGNYRFTMQPGGERIKVTINYSGTGANGYLDWIEVNYEDKRVSAVASDVKAAVAGGESDDERRNGREIGRLHGMGNAEYLIITDEEFIAEADRLGSLHQWHDGMSYAVVTQKEIFYEYSDGTPSVEAYRSFITQMAASGTRYVVLMGDGCFDNRGLLREQSKDDHWKLLTYQSIESYSEGGSYCSDDWFGITKEGSVDLKRDTMSVAVGRINAYTKQQAKEYVDKVERYMANDDLGEWKNRAIIVADDGDNNIHVRGADGVAELTENLYPSLLVRKLYMDSYKQQTTTQGESYPLLKKELDDYIADGSLLIEYVGHGGYANLSNEQIISYTDMINMDNRRLPLWMTGTCNFSRFDDTKDSGGEIMTLNPNGGAIAMISTTRTVYSGLNEALMQEVTRHLLQPGVTIGEALRRGKNARASLNDGNRLCFALLGDPALRLNWAWDRDIRCTYDKDTAGAMDIVTLSGTVNEGDDVDVDFDGYVHITVFDKEETVRTLSNDDPTLEPFAYKYRINPIFKGKTTVSEGRFEIRFVVPKDIRYNLGSARVVMYAWDEQRGIEGNGNDEGLTIGGESPVVVEDTLGPEVILSFNTLTVKEKYEVGENPLMIVRLFDDYGINTCGSGIGHDIMMWVDDDEGVVLNNYYEAVMGSYQQGKVEYRLSGISKGWHDIRFRCWDMMNNSATAQCRIHVTEGKENQMENVEIVPNPAVFYTDIIVTGDAPGVENDVSVDIFDVCGRKVWSWNDDAVMYDVGGKVVIRWNLQGATSAGVYYAKVRLGKSSVKTVKILVCGRKFS